MSGKSIGGVLVLTGLVIMGLVGLLGREASPAPAATNRWTGLASPLPPEQAFQKAWERAREWQPDAVLVRVEASWRPGERWLEVRTLPVTWLFTFYSSAARALATVSVNAEKTYWIPPVEVAYAPRPLPAFPPPYGVDRMWMTFRAAGGEEFVRQYPDALIHIVLQVGEEGTVWQMDAVGVERSLKVRMSAETGVLIP
ncbi:MAG: hypothetical protein H5T61_03530 [Thermoflexales bacterium]|nr:hypothetical protein [Thermoflexales bacterium]